MSDPSILEQARQELDALSPDELRDQLAALKAKQAEQAATRKAYNAKPEVKAKRAESQAKRAAGKLDPKSEHYDPEAAKRFEERLRAQLDKARAVGIAV